MEKTTHIKKTPGRIAARVAIYFVLVVTAVSTIFPYLWMVLASFKTGLEITTSVSYTHLTLPTILLV